MGQVLVLGLINGGIYAIFALGVVLVYRGTGVLTFANGEIGTLSLYFAYFLVEHVGAPWLVGAAGAILMAAAVGGLFEFFFVRRMVQADPVTTAVLTVGLLLLLLALEFFCFGASPRDLRPPTRTGTFSAAGVVVHPWQVAALVVALALGFGLQSALRRSDFGLGVLAAAQDPTAVRLVGAPLSRITLTVWSVGAGLSGLAALLVEPSVGFITPGYASELFVIGLAAAVIGGLTSLPGAVYGGVVLGIAQSASSRWLSSFGVSGLQYIVVLTVLLVVLLGRAYLPELRRRFDAPPTSQPPQATTAGAVA
ncbi:MAG: branched-chain amino acid transport system permease protein [Actinomycetota bacterium]|jgi:branched-subunit amino acid ABC-type transport system permease component|nr:branched-chain amino acid transport system permease protein [Actinomycetota bacterium]